MDFHVAEPCSERWDGMTRRADGRFCDRYQHTVVDLTSMSRRDAERRARRAEGDYLCVRLAVDDEGGAVFRHDRRRAPHFAGGLVLVAALTAGGCRSSPPSDEPSVVTAPCSIDDPPMMPIDESATADDAPGPRATNADASTEVAPTPEQIELTRQKREAQRATNPPVIHRVMGRMPIQRY